MYRASSAISSRSNSAKNWERPTSATICPANAVPSPSFSRALSSWSSVLAFALSAMANVFSAVRARGGAFLAAALRAGTPAAHSLGKRIEQRAAVVPADTAVGDALAIHERFPRHEVLAAGLEMTLDHDAENAALTRRHLMRHVAPHLDLFLWIFARVGVAEIDHQLRDRS